MPYLSFVFESKYDTMHIVIKKNLQEIGHVFLPPVLDSKQFRGIALNQSLNIGRFIASS